MKFGKLMATIVYEYAPCFGAILGKFSRISSKFRFCPYRVFFTTQDLRDCVKPLYVVFE